MNALRGVFLLSGRWSSGLASRHILNMQLRSSVAPSQMNAVFARGMAKKGGDKKGRDDSDSSSGSATAATFDLKVYEQEMKLAGEGLKKVLSTVRSSGATPGLLDRVIVNAYGQQTPLSKLAQVTAPNPQSLVVNLFDQNLVVDVVKAINAAELNLVAQADGKVVRVPIPKLTEDTRGELVKLAAKYAEQNRVRVRQARKDAMDALKGMKKTSSEDDIKRIEKQVQTLTDKHIKEIDDIYKKKEDEILRK